MERPQGLDMLCRTTNFSRREIQLMYRGFKQECPSGVVNEETFKQIYGQFFPLGNANRYAQYVFRTFNRNRNGHVGFQDIVTCLSALSRGSAHDKLRWAFRLYDLDDDGRIRREEVVAVVSAVYELMERYSLNTSDSPAPNEQQLAARARNHAHRIFQKLDRNGDGVVTVDEFMAACLKDSVIAHSLDHLDTVL